MIISDSLPIQFWITGTQTFNEEVLCGLMKQDCFCQPVECDDEITIQFINETEFELPEIPKLVIGQDGSDLAYLDFTHDEVNGEHVYSVTFSFSEYLSPCTDIQVSLRISIFTLEDLSGDISDLMETVSGEITNTDATYLSGDITDLMETTEGEMMQSQGYLFGHTLSGGDEFDSCDLPFMTLYWDKNDTFNTGITLYTDPALTTPYTGSDYVSKDGDIWNINSANGIVGMPTGNSC